MVPSLQTLFMPLESGDVSPEGPVLFLQAAWHPVLPALGADLWQPFKPLAAELEGHGLKLMAELPQDKAYRLALVHLPKQVEEAKYMLATALENLAEGGTLLAAAANDAGGGRLLGWLKYLGFEAASLSKNKARAVWVSRPAQLPPILHTWKEAGVRRSIDFGDGLSFKTMPGLFSWNKIDFGSRLLAQNLPDVLSGHGADFGAGIGYLSHYVLSNFPRVKSLQVIEADHRALACAQANLEGVQGERTTAFHWADLSRPVASLPALDFIVMNPPFHTGKKTDSPLGQDFIKTAAHHLRKGGILMMVANTHLPYEAVLEKHFFKTETVFHKDGFKIFRAAK